MEATETVEDIDMAPASFQQRRVWSYAQLDPKINRAHNIPLTLLVKGQLNVDKLAEIIGMLVARHESLRTNFIVKNDELRQVIREAKHFSFNYTDLQNDSGQLAKLMNQELLHTFDLRHEPLLRVNVIRTGEQQYVICLLTHHTVFDNVSSSVLLNELSLLYNNSSKDRMELLPTLKRQYKDYAIETMSPGRNASASQFWTGQVSKIHLPALIPDFNWTSKRSFEGETLDFPIGRELTEQARQIAKSLRVTPFVIWYTLIHVLVGKYTREQAFTMGCTIQGRDNMSLYRQIGMYVNVIPITISIDAAANLAGFIEQSRKVFFDFFRHGGFPVETVVPPQLRSSGEPLLFDMVINWANEAEPQDINIFNGLLTSVVSTKSSQVKYQLEFNFTDRQDELLFTINYDKSLYRADRMRLMGQHLLNLASGVAQNAYAPFDSIPLLTKEEETRIIHQFNNTSMSFGPFRSVIERIFAVNNDTIAVVDVDGTQHSYQELNHDSRLLGATLRTNHGVNAGSVVGIVGLPAYDTIISALAVMRLGAIYLPMDASEAVERLRFIVQDAGVAVILASADIFIDLNVPVIKPHTAIDFAELKFEETLLQENDGAYLIYTSGTTGRPKGVINAHKALVNLVDWHNQAFQVDCSCKATLYASIGFDASVWEIWPYLAAGASLYVIPTIGRLDTAFLENFYSSREITHTFLPSPVCEVFLKHCDPVVIRQMTCLTGGDVFHPTDKMKNYKVFVNYGLSEAAVVSTSGSLREYTAPSSGTLIGKPIANTFIYILNTSKIPVPVRSPGEIYIAGSGVSNGYVNNEQLTSERFDTDPFNGGIMYRTGDYGYWDEEGNIFYLGRFDNQVKISGNRIELREIESVLLEYPSVIQAAVVFHAQSNRLVACYVSATEILETDLKIFIRQRLPAQMLPRMIGRVETIPWNINGKIDYAAVARIVDKLVLSAQIVALGESVNITPVGQTILTVWKEVLNLSDIDPARGFFEIGGTSLLLIEAHARLLGQYPFLKAVDLFTYPSAIQLAEYIQHYTDRPDELEKLLFIEAEERSFDHGAAPGKESIDIEFVFEKQTSALEEIGKYIVAAVMYALHDALGASVVPVYLASGDHAAKLLTCDFSLLDSADKLFESVGRQLIITRPQTLSTENHAFSNFSKLTCLIEMDQANMVLPTIRQFGLYIKVDITGKSVKAMLSTSGRRLKSEVTEVFMSAFAGVLASVEETQII